MKTFAVMGIAVAAFISLGSMGSVAQAQGVGIGVGPGGVGVHVDDGYRGHRRYHREREYRRERYERRRYMERRHHHGDRIYVR